MKGMPRQSGKKAKRWGMNEKIFLKKYLSDYFLLPLHKIGCAQQIVNKFALRSLALAVAVLASVLHEVFSVSLLNIFVL